MDLPLFLFEYESKKLLVLGVETSCDETGLALFDTKLGLLAHKIYSQDIHIQYGGVVPELASRDHVQKLLPLLQDLLRIACVDKKNISAVAYTAGPGLVGALMVGAVFAKSLALCLGVPHVAVHHMEGHLLAPMLESNAPKFPFLALLVSGGHTMLVRVDDFGKYGLIGESLDDAAGEAFDKIAKLLGLGYPGGAALEKLAKKGSLGHFYFPRPLMEGAVLDFSFSGLKTCVANTIRSSDISNEQIKADIACAFQDAVIDVLVNKCISALKLTKLSCLVVAGGVSANEVLRLRLQELAQVKNFSVYYPRLEFCTDNGAMIAYAGSQHLLRGVAEQSLAVEVFPRWQLHSSI